jgi:hypothetical protein
MRQKIVVLTVPTAAPRGAGYPLWRVRNEMPEVLIQGAGSSSVGNLGELGNLTSRTCHPQHPAPMRFGHHN